MVSMVQSQLQVCLWHLTIQHLLPSHTCRVLAPPEVAAGSGGSGAAVREWGGCGAGGDDAVDTPDDLEVSNIQVWY